MVAAQTQPTGFSPGVASRLRLANGQRVFLKAVHEAANAESADIHRREARVLAEMPATAPVPRLLWSHDEGGWVALCLEDVDGRHPHEPWTEADLTLVIGAIQRMAADLTPSPIDPGATAADAFGGNINGWRIAKDRGETRLDEWSLRNLDKLAELEAEAPGACAGDTLLHFDTRADNILIAGESVYVVDWPWARTGAPWVDWVAMAPSVAMQGGPEPGSFLGRFHIADVQPRAIDAVLCSLAGYFAVGSLEPPPPGIPTLRAFQAAQGGVAISWLRERTGWD